MGEGDHGLAAAAKIAVDAEYKAHQHAVQGVGAQILGRRRNHLRVAGENPGQRLRPELGVDTDRSSEDQGIADAALKRAPGPLRLVGPHVLGRHGRHGGGEGRGRQHGESHEPLHHAHGGRSHHAHGVDDHRDDQKRDIDQSVLHGQRRAHQQNPLHCVGVGLKMPPPEVKGKSPPGDDKQRQKET